MSGDPNTIKLEEDDSDTIKLLGWAQEDPKAGSSTDTKPDDPNTVKLEVSDDSNATKLEASDDSNAIKREERVKEDPEGGSPEEMDTASRASSSSPALFRSEKLASLLLPNLCANDAKNLEGNRVRCHGHGDIVCEDCNLVQVIFTTLDGFTELFLTDDHSTALMSARRNTALNTERFVEASY
jgi:hypothetical protein